MTAPQMRVESGLASWCDLKLYNLCCIEMLSESL
jgi:hypothetical protein